MISSHSDHSIRLNIRSTRRSVAEWPCNGVGLFNRATLLLDLESNFTDLINPNCWKLCGHRSRRGAITAKSLHLSASNFIPNLNIYYVNKLCGRTKYFMPASRLLHFAFTSWPFIFGNRLRARSELFSRFFLPENFRLLIAWKLQTTGNFPM